MDMYTVVRGPPPPASSATVNNAIADNSSADSCTPNLLPPGARSDDERFASSLLEIVQAEGKVGDEYGVNTTSTTGIFGRGARRKDNGRLATVFLVTNFLVGSGILNTPQSFRSSGLVAATFLFFVAGESWCVDKYLSRPAPVRI